jgi:hypothetical protein
MISKSLKLTVLKHQEDLFVRKMTTLQIHIKQI